FGGLYKLHDKLSLFAMYGLNYEGPGLARSEGRLFSERAIKHSFLFEPSLELGPGRLRTKLFYITEDRRSGTNEIWGKGLYDYDSLGFSVGYEKTIFDWSVFPYVRWMDMKFPNYTDLLREFEQGGLTAEIAGGQIDQILTAYGVALTKRPYIIEISYSLSDFDRESVVESNGVYGSNLQKDSTLDASLSGEVTLWRFVLMPKGAYRQKRSNQNYMRFAYFGDPAPVFVPKNYDFNEYSVGGQLHLKVTLTKSIFGSLDLNDRTYTDRPPRNASRRCASTSSIRFAELSKK
ncbi:MAG: hypothetical protein AABZ44_09685, partial [Elusimicrobiota bacterium]